MEQTPAQKLGFEIGKCYCVVSANAASKYASHGDILRFTADDGSDCPWFYNVTTGEPGVAAHLHRLGPVKSMEMAEKLFA